jgi:SNF2 family DNA or RNA helicase
VSLFEGGAIHKEVSGNKITISGLYSTTLDADIKRIYRVDPNEAKLFFAISHSGILFKKSTMTFHKYFALEMYSVFEKLYYLTGRTMYKLVMDRLMEEPQVANYFKPILELPAEITSRLDSLSTPLFPFQRAFMESYYNAKHKLGLHGYLLAFEQGLGKTFTAIAASYAFDMAPSIVTAPKSTLDGWKKSILNMVPGIKDEDVKLIYEYDPKKDHHPWKYMICNFERLEQALQYSEYAAAKPNSLLIDECHNFRYMNTHRSQMLVSVKETLNITNVIAISGTPIKALAAELIPIIKLLDPMFDDSAEKIFKRIYSRSNYDPMAASVLKQRLQLFIERRRQEDSIKLPNKERYNINITISNPQPFLIEQVKKDVWQYVNEHTEDFSSQITTNFDKLQKLVRDSKAYDEIDSKDKESYIELVNKKINTPISSGAQMADINQKIKEYELDVFKQYDSATFKELLKIRRSCTSYLQMLLGKAMGIYFIKGKINLIGTMVEENVDEMAKLIRSAQKKVIIFSTYVEPLQRVKDALEQKGIGCIVHTGGDDIVYTRSEFKDNNDIRCLLGTTASIGTGTDGLQFIADMMIFLNQPYRSADTAQCEARIHRKGQDCDVKIYFMKLITDQPNILAQESLINDWSREMFRLAID